jgi:hypothetical protein
MGDYMYSSRYPVQYPCIRPYTAKLSTNMDKPEASFSSFDPPITDLDDNQRQSRAGRDMDSLRRTLLVQV